MSFLTRTSLAVACALALAVSAASSAPAASSVRVGSLPSAPAGARALGAMPSSTPLNIAVALQPSDPAGLEAFAEQVSTPGSSVYHAYITPAQFAARFGPPASAIDAVEASLRAHGLNPGPVSANGLSIPISATAGRLSQAFSLSLKRLALPSGRVATTSTAAPMLDANIAGRIQGVIGLSSVSAPSPLLARAFSSAAAAHAASHVATGGPQPCADARQAAPANSAYTADQIASAYGFSGLYGQGDEGAGQTIAVYELEPYDPNDIAAYQSCYGTHAAIANVSVDGGPGSGPGAGEAAFDIEQVVGLAPKASVLVYEGPNSNSGAPGAGPYDTWSAIVSQDRAQVVTASWGQCEEMEGGSDASAESTLFQEAAAQGQTLVSASGDNGSEDCNAPLFSSQGLPSAALAVDDPASQPFMTGVGGTTLSSLGPRPTESVWNSGANILGDLTGFQPGAGGGGISSFWGMTSYQSGAAASLNVAQSQSREVPDVSADADPHTGYLIFWNGSGSQEGQPAGWQGIGGTSGAAPVWATLLALVNASSSCQGDRVGFANPVLYRSAGAAYGSDFNDIRAGNNDFTGNNGGRYGAATGYDMASGLGTPNAASLAATVCRSADLLIGAPHVSSVSLSGVRRERPMLAFTVTAGGNAPALKSLALRLSGGLRFGRRVRRLTITGPKGKPVAFSYSVRHGLLTIVLRGAKTRVRVRIASPALAATGNEAKAARRGRPRKVTLALATIDARGHATPLAAKVKPRS